MKARRGLLGVSLLVAAALALPGTASSYTAASGYTAKDYATNFPFAPGPKWGPVGLAFDKSDNLYVSNFYNGHLYRFQPGGGVAGPSTRITATPLLGGIKGLAFTRDGSLYMARAVTGDVVEVNVRNGRVERTVAKGLRCPTGLATDPLSGDLFVSQSTCRGEIMRISDFGRTVGKTSIYARTGCCSDGLAFAPDGTLYAASAGHILQIEGTDKSTAGAVHSIAALGGADGVAVGLPAAGESPFLVVNGTDGRVTRLDFSQSPPTGSTILHGGTRGDFVAVDSRGCLYVTQTDSVVRISRAERGCDLASSTPGAGGVSPGIVIDTVGGVKKAGKCIVSRRLIVRVRQRGRVRLRIVRVYVNGKHRRTVRNRRVSAPIVIRRVPLGRFTVKMVARTNRGKKLTAKKRYRVCRKGAIAHH